MHSDIKAFFDRQFMLLETGRIDELSALFKTPFPVYRENGLFIEASHKEVKTAMTIIYSSFQEAGVARVDRNVLSVDEKKGTSTVRVVLEILYVNRDDNILRQSRLHYFLEPTEESFLIALVEYDQAGFPEVFELLNQQRRHS